MTVYSVPHTFIPGTKAKANEVNENFSVVLDYISDTKQSSSDVNLSNITQEAKNVIYNNSVPTHLIGEIVTSPIPLSDGGLHLLDGTLLSGSGAYSTFVEYMASLVSNYSDLFCTETEWQQELTENSKCGKFVYDSVAKTLRLPKVSEIPTINTTEPDNSAINVYYYIVISNGIKKDIDVNIDNIATDLNSKADIDLSNMNASASAKSEVTNWNMLDYSAQISFSWGTSFTAPSNGIIMLGRNGYGGSVGAYYWTVNNGSRHGFGGNNSGMLQMQVPVSKGDILTTVGGNAQANEYAHFYPMKGVN